MNLSSTEPESEKYEALLDEEDIMPSGGKWKWVLAVAFSVCLAAGISVFFMNIKMKDDKYDKILWIFKMIYRKKGQGLA